VGRLRELAPGSTFALYSYLPKRDRALVSDPDVVVHSSTPAYLVLVLFPASIVLALLRWIPGIERVFPASVRDMRRADALVDLAGVSFIDGREKFLPFNVLTILPAILLGTPVFKLSQAMGPFENPLNRVAARALWRCALVVPRGPATLEHLREARYPDERLFPAPDTAFAFEAGDALSDEGADEVADITAEMDRLAAAGRTTVGMCPSSVIASKAASQGWDYADFLADVVRSVLADGRAVVLFPNATRASSGKLRNNDLPVIAGVVERLGEKTAARVMTVRGDVAAGGLRRIVERCECVAVSRFHAMIGALAAGVPCLVLGWSHKYAEVMAEFGLEGYVVDHAEADAVAFGQRLTALCRERDEVAERIAERLPEVVERSRAQFREVVERVERG
jgi:polysaccharide pyruvyl transferase WcaK-like protein